MPTSKSVNAFGDLVALMEKLRSEDGCPWDREQTPESLKPYLLEEAYEVLEALDHKDPALICEELGDLLLQIVFLAQIFRERGNFSIEEVARGITDKLVRRHPHVFAGASCSDLEELSRQWNRIKQKEKSQRLHATNAKSEVPPTLPALMRAQKLASRNLVNPSPASLERLEQAFGLSSTAPGEMQEQLLAEIFLAAAAWGQRQGIDSEQALREYLNRNERRA